MKVLEHIVDAVLQFEGDRQYMYRLLRATKNRFGSTSELGIYEMQRSGLREVSNPSEMLVSTGGEELSGVAVGVTRGDKTVPDRGSGIGQLCRIWYASEVCHRL